MQYTLQTTLKVAKNVYVHTMYSLHRFFSRSIQNIHDYPITMVADKVTMVTHAIITRTNACPQ